MEEICAFLMCPIVVKYIHQHYQITVCCLVILQYGDTILIHTVKGNHLELVRALLKKYADVDVQGVVSFIQYLMLHCQLFLAK